MSTPPPAVTRVGGRAPVAARVLRFTALGGVVLIAIVARNATMPALILMIASGIVVPLGLALGLDIRATTPRDPRDPGVEAFVVHRHAVPWIAPLAVVGGVVGWVFAPGSAPAIAGAAMHAAVCVCAGLLALARMWPMLRRRKLDPLPELAIDLGLLFLPAAAVWLLASRAGVPLAGFHEPVVTFTAAHFHFAGFAAPTILGHVGRMLEGSEEPTPPKKTAPRLYRVATLAVCLGVPLTAVGIATNHTIEQIAAVTVAAGMLTASVVLVGFASRRAGSPLAAGLFVVSGATLLLTMTLAATFALTASAGRGSTLHGAVPLQMMIDYHGAANAMGFALAGLVALTLRRLRSSRATAPQTP